ncbi:MAG: hypothetical protein AAGC55_34135, partial [Myxococcota bacterium]
MVEDTRNTREAAMVAGADAPEDIHTDPSAMLPRPAGQPATTYSSVMRSPLSSGLPFGMRPELLPNDGCMHELVRRGDVIDRYVVLRHIASGGTGVVAEAHDPDLERRVALKLVPASAAGSALMREARALACLRHNNVIEVYDVGTA